MKTIQLSRYKLHTFLNCQRQFQLTYMDQLAWPKAPIPAEMNAQFAFGQAFHHHAEQFLQGIPIETDGMDAELHTVWKNFLAIQPNLPKGTFYPELALSVPMNSQAIYGRIDLLIAGDDGSITIYDWKTEQKPRSAVSLQTSWQTKLYQYLAVEGAKSIGKSVEPEQVRLVYWFARQPEASATLRYTKEDHLKTTAHLLALVEQIEQRIAIGKEAIWPLTNEFDTCDRCTYRPLCGRVATIPARPIEIEEPLFPEEFSLEPPTP